jgi:hypothetical protein
VRPNAYRPAGRHNIRLPDGRYTVGADAPSDPRLAWMLETIRLHASKPFDELRVLDLACLEGLFAIECALHGAQAVGIEGRSENLDRAQYAADQLGLANISLVQDDSGRGVIPAQRAKKATGRGGKRGNERACSGRHSL